MPETISYTCVVCGKTVNDEDLVADTTLRRLIVNANGFKATPEANGQLSAGIVSTDPGDPLIFCGQADAAAWVTNWAW